MGINYQAGIILVALIFWIQLASARKYITSIFDPLVYTFLLISFSFGFIFVEGDGYEKSILTTFLYVLAYYAGFFASAKKLKYFKKDISVNFSDVKFLEAMLCVTFCAWIAGNIYAWEKVGIPAFSVNPDFMKSAAYENGLGWVRRMNWGVANFIYASTVILVVIKKRYVYWALLGVEVVVASLSGSKSALLPIVFISALLLGHPLFKRYVQPSRRLAVVTILSIVAIIVAMFIFASDGGGQTSIVDNVIKRLFYFGDIFFYSNNKAVLDYSKNVGPLDYLFSIVNPIFGFLRLVPYQTPLGNIIVNASLPAGEVLAGNLGPNVPFFVKGWFYFGFFGGGAYAFFIGLIIGKIRNKYFSAGLKNLRGIAFFASIIIISISLPVDDVLFVSMLWDFCFFYFLAFIFVKILISVSRGAREYRIKN